MEMTRRSFMKWIGIVPTVITLMSGAKVSAQTLPARLSAPAGDLQTMQARVTLTLNGKKTRHSKTLGMKIGENKFHFTDLDHQVYTGYVLETGMGKIAGEDFKDPLLVCNLGDTITIVLKGA